MDWTLQQIRLENFKFFKKPFDFQTHGKNVLLYGENGSGKSSVVWGLYTLMESHKKPLADVQKYFNPRDGQHLRNRYSNDTDVSSVQTLFTPSAGGTAVGSAPKSYEISFGNINTQTVGDDFIKFTAAAFDMFNYRMLYEWIYQKNSKDIDLFNGFEKDIFKYLYLSRPYTRIDGTVPAQDGNTAEEWWSYIKEATNHLPLTRRHQVNRNSPEYTRFTTLLSDFKREMDTVLMQVERAANDMLHHDLGLQAISIEIDMSPVPFNNLKPNCRRYKDGKVHNPTISVTAHVIDSNVPGWSTDVKHLATYFNESKLTCIGIALRLAISDYKLISTGNVAPVLCIDDLLLSLDMSSRIPIVKLLLKKSQNRQLLVFTHDRAFYDTMKMLIQDARKMGDWRFYEMYERNSRQLGSVPEPIFHQAKSYREKAEEQFEKCDYPAAANYLRKYCEEQLKRLLPTNMQFRTKQSGEVEIDDLNGMISKLQSSFCSLYKVLSTELPQLSVYRKRLMNPLSHDDAHTPIYKAEIEGAVTEIDTLKAIADSKKDICTGEGHHRDEFQMLVDNGRTNELIEFDVLEKWTSIEIRGRRYYKDVKIRVQSSTTAAIAVREHDSLRAVFNDVCILLGMDTPALPAPVMETTITNRHLHVALTAM